jgi:hypothetical protein
MATDAFKTPGRPRFRVTKERAADRAHPWTASRCQRLLRPLLSRISLLRRELASRALPVPATLASAAEAGAAPVGKRSAVEDRAFLLPRKKLRHTYSRRWADRPSSRSIYDEGDSDDVSRGVGRSEGARFKAARDLQRDDATGEVVAFTPLVRRARGHQVSSPLQASGSSVTHAHNQQVDQQQMPATTIPTTAARRRRGAATGHADLEQRLALLRDQVGSPAVFANYDAIYHNLEALLDVASPEQPTRKGASSLLDMCLAKMPQYIGGVQAWEIFEAEKRGTKSTTTGSDVSLRMYSELESLSASGTGWAPLRAVARADALAVIRGAMAEELFADDFSILLMDLCARYAEARELNGLFEVFVSRQYPEPLNAQSVFAEAGVLQPLSYLRDFATQTDHKHLLLQYYSSLLVQGLLPHKWLATSEFEHIWALAYRMVSRGGPALDAVDFLATSITLLSRYQRSNRKHGPQDAKNDISSACQQTFIRALSILSAMRRSGEGAVQAGSNSQVGLQRAARISRSIDFTLHACITEVGSWRGRRGKPRDLLSLAVFLSSPQPQGGRVDMAVTRAFEVAYGCGQQDNRGGVVSSSSRKQQHIDDTIISLISSVAQICPRGTGEASRDCLQGILAQLGRLGLPDGVLHDITRAGAFALARQTNDLRDLLYAEQLVSTSLTSDGDGGSNSSPHASQSQRRTYFDGFRWDETISEWVTVSPTVQRRKILRRRSAAFVPTRTAGGSIRPRSDVARSGTSFRPLPASSTSIVTDTPGGHQSWAAGSTAETSDQILPRTQGPASPGLDKRGQTMGRRRDYDSSSSSSNRLLGLRGHAPIVHGRNGMDAIAAARRQRAVARLCDELADDNDGGQDSDDDDDDNKENHSPAVPAVVVRGSRLARTTTTTTTPPRKRHSAGAVLSTAASITRAQPPADRRQRRRVVLRLSVSGEAASHSDDELAM